MMYWHWAFCPGAKAVMPKSSVHHFSDPDEYAAAVRAAKLEITMQGAGPFTASLTRVDFHRLWMQRLIDSGHRVAHARESPERAIIEFPIEPDGEVIERGVPLPRDAVVRRGVGDEFFQRAPRKIGWGAMSLPIADMAALGATMAASDLAPPSEARVVMPPPAALARLRQLHAEAGQLARTAPEIIENREAARGLEQALIAAMAGCLENAEGGEDASSRRRHDAIMRRFHKVLEEEPNRALYLPELCAATGVPERTLRVCCQEHLGMGPKRYLVLRRLHLAHRALSQAAPGRTTVTDIATEFGFWQFGRFAGAYRALFGETPSATLRRPPA